MARILGQIRRREFSDKTKTSLPNPSWVSTYWWNRLGEDIYSQIQWNGLKSSLSTSRRKWLMRTQMGCCLKPRTLGIIYVLLPISSRYLDKRFLVLSLHDRKSLWQCCLELLCSSKVCAFITAVFLHAGAVWDRAGAWMIYFALYMPMWGLCQVAPPFKFGFNLINNFLFI